jgi:hypothetical protein
MADSSKPIGFLAFKKDEHGDIDEFAVIPDQDKLESWKAGPIPGPEVPEVTPTVAEPKVLNSRDRVTSLLDRFRNSMMSVHSMIDFTSAIAPGMTQYFINHRLTAHARKNLSLREDDGVFLIYNLSRNNLADTSRLLEEFDIDKQGFDALPSATLLSLVATFDSYFSEIVHFFLSIHPERYTESDKQISLKELFTRKSLEEVVSQVIDLEVSQLMRGSHTEQVQFIESHLDVKIIGHYARWPNFVEIFERRNLVAHGDLIASESYITNCRSAKDTDIEDITVGQQLSLTPEYLHKATDALSEFGILLVFVLWRKHIKNSAEDAFKYVSETCYDLIRKKRSQLAQKLLEFALYKQPRACSDRVIRMMLVNLANSYKIMKNEPKCQEVISSIDWTASGDNFQICIASLQGDVDKVVGLMPGLAASKAIDAKAIDANSFREWPVFDWVRDDSKINETFERVYGEPMRNKVAEGITSVKTTEVPEPEPAVGGLSPTEMDATRH